MYKTINKEIQISYFPLSLLLIDYIFVDERNCDKKSRVTSVLRVK